MRTVVSFISLLFMAVSGSSADAVDQSEWADLRLQFVLDTDRPPKPAKLNIVAMGNPVVIDSEVMRVDPTTKGIKDLVMSPGRRPKITSEDVHPDLDAFDQPPVVVEIKNFAISPHVFTVRPGQVLQIRNRDPIQHMLNFAFFNARLVAQNNIGNSINSIPPNGVESLKVSAAEIAPTPIDDNLWPWIRGYVVVPELPYVGISDTEGILSIENLPAGKPIVLKIWHENQVKSIAKVNFSGQDVEWSKGQVELTLKPGMNDLGIVKIKYDQFK